MAIVLHKRAKAFICHFETPTDVQLMQLCAATSNHFDTVIRDTIATANVQLFQISAAVSNSLNALV